MAAMVLFLAAAGSLSQSRPLFLSLVSAKSPQSTKLANEATGSALVAFLCGQLDPRACQVAAS
jgi:hypothetical protein